MAHKKYQNLSQKGKEKKQQYGPERHENDMKNKGWLSTGKIILKK